MLVKCLTTELHPPATVIFLHNSMGTGRSAKQLRAASTSQMRRPDTVTPQQLQDVTMSSRTYYFSSDEIST